MEILHTKLRKICLCGLIFVLILSFLLGSIFVVYGNINSIKQVNAEGLPISNGYTSAKAMCVMETTTGRVLYAKNQKQQLAMASTTKIMTAITAIENCKNLDEKFVISPKAVGISGTSLYLRKDESFSIRELLYGLMLISGNDASVAIGEHVGGEGGVKNFIQMMNDLAVKIGAKNSHFDNTHGLDSKTHYTTAEDLARITSYAMENEIFRDIVSTRSTKIVSGEGKTRYLKNKNRLLSSLEGCDGVKTGFTDDAGRCLVSSCCRDGMRLVCVVLNCGPMFEESASLLDKGFDEFKLYDLSKFFSYNRYLSVEGAKVDKVALQSDGKTFFPLKASELENIKITYTLPKSLQAPLSKSQKVGEICIFFDNDLLFSQNIYTMEEVRSNTILEGIKDITSKW